MRLKDWALLLKGFWQRMMMQEWIASALLQLGDMKHVVDLGRRWQCQAICDSADPLCNLERTEKTFGELVSVLSVERRLPKRLKSKKHPIICLELNILSLNISLILHSELSSG